jgi:DNA-binding MarR family transcriptional regulator
LVKREDQIDRILGQWAREVPRADLRDMEVVGRIQRAAQILRTQLDEMHARSGLSGGLFDVLATLRRSGKPYRLSPTELYRWLMLTSGAMTNRLDRLESEGHIRRVADSSDRRGMLVELTAKGKATIDGALAMHLENEKRLLAAIPARGRRQLADLLRDLLISWESE